MNTKMTKLLLLSLLPAVVLTLASCSKGHKKDSAMMNQPVEIGRMEAVAVTTAATVESIDYASRSVTFRGPNGATGTYRCGNEVRNFGKIKVGDQVRTTLLESMAVFVGPADVKPSIGNIQTVALAPKGAKPSMVVANTAQATVRIKAVDTANRTVTLLGVADVPRTLTVGPNVDLANLKAGDNVMIRYTEAMAIVVEKP